MADTKQKTSVNGRMMLVNPSTSAGIRSGDIAYISCDSFAYSGNLNATWTINKAVTSGPGAILLYSTASGRCTFAPTNDFIYDILFTMPDANTSMVLEKGLTVNSPPNASIKLYQQQSNNGSSGDVLGKSPSTAVAMIILYSITGIITALFLIIIVVGALRAHRHPERYGPRHVIGRARQSRAKGIARAMLETLPIVKFGEREDRKHVEAGGTSSQGEGTHPDPDVELGTTEGRDRTASPTATEDQIPSASHPPTVNPQPTENEPNAVPDTVTTETHPGTSAPNPEALDSANTDNGLACSVCTDDFVKGQDIRVLPCNHKFHPECIDPWLLNVSGTCPLCRVDLRPTTSRNSTDDPSSEPPLTDLPPDTNTPSNSRSRTGLSTYLHHTLNIHRMRDATPQERIAALRRLRTQQQEAQAEASERPRNRMSARLSRAFHFGSRPQSTVVDPHSSLSTPAPGREPERVSESDRALNDL